METEVWPNMVAQCMSRQIPVALVNARLSERSQAKAQRLGGLIREAARGLSCVAAQTIADAGRLQQLGVRNVHVAGSIKFDVTPPENMLKKGAALRAQIGPRPVLLCASTRDGEEGMILDALSTIGMTDALLIIVPRHPQRFDDVAAMTVERGFRMERRSTLGDMQLAANVRVLLGDSMGEMFAYYAACDVAFIGGSLLPLGGQNLIEACAVGKPVLLGPYTFNFKAVCEDAIDNGAALRVHDAAGMLAAAQGLLNVESRRADMGAKAALFARQHRGATARTMGLLQPLLLGSRMPDKAMPAHLTV
jgi:3-deoxy-D-manno-octulosonic-acid transferase